jgi:Cu(I)/Ag(I) efflux system membrane fusion protein
MMKLFKKGSLKGFNMNSLYVRRGRSLWNKVKNSMGGSLEGFNYFALGLILITIMTTIFSGCQSKQENKSTYAKASADTQKTDVYYTCSMHPQVHEDKPGNCPICGMKLIKVESSTEENGMPLDSSLSYLINPVTKTVVGSFKVIEPVKREPEDTIIADGYIGFDKRAINKVNTRVTGRIEKLYVKYANQRISKGQPLMTIYSPELLSAQRDLLQVTKDNDQSLISALKEKLLNLGMHSNEIKKVLQSGKPLTRITIYSPYSGISQHTDATASSGNTSELLNVKEGMYVNKGQTVFSIQNIDKTWAVLNVFTGKVSHINSGDPVSLYSDADPENIVKGRIDFIPPYRNQDEKTTRVRAYLNNMPESWKIGTLFHGRIAINEQNKGWYIPLSAVNDLGMHKVIWVQDKKRPGIFHAREVETGLQTSDSVEVISGINPGDKIVANAAYMVGSDSFIQ